MLVELTATDAQDMHWLKPYYDCINQLPLAVVVYDAAGKVACFNQRAAALWGLGAEQTAKTELIRFDCADGGDFIRDALQSSQPSHDFPLVVVHADDTRTQALANIAPMGDADNAVRGAIMTVQPLMGNLADTCTADERLPSPRLPEVVDGFPAFVAELWGADHVIERVNLCCDDMMGGADLIGKTAAQAWPQLREQGYLNYLDQVFETGEPYSGTDLPVWLRSRPGAPFAHLRCDFRYEPMRDSAGVVNGVLIKVIGVGAKGTSVAAQAALEAEKKLRLYETILANTPDFIYVFDLNHRYTYANAALLELWGKSADDAIGKNFLELGYEPWHVAMHDREIDRVIRTKQEVRGEVPFKSAAGTRIFEYIFVPVLGDGGEVEAIAGTTRDTTGRKQLERELQQRAEELAESDRKKDEFIAMLAHELRNPLAPIRNGLQVMEMAAGDQAVVEQARIMMQRQLKHMVRLVDDLMDVSRITRNKLNLQRTAISIDDVIDSAIETAKPALESAGHTLTVTLPPQPFYLNADLTRLAQVFSNLLSNSIKYTKPGGHINLRAEAAGENLKIELSDNGIGIPSHKLGSVFDLFSQVSSNARDGDGGLGIGLALVKALISMHGGTVGVVSNWPEGGTTFTVTLPCAAEPMLPAEDAVRPPGNAVVQGTRRILVADDNRDACLSMSQLFELLGHEVKSAFNGAEALVLAEDFKPEVIFMDLGMPQLNGFEATRRIRAQPWGQSIRIVAVTGWGQECDRANSKSAGFDGHLVKPVNLQAIQEQLRVVGP